MVYAGLTAERVAPRQRAPAKILCPPTKEPAIFLFSKSRRMLVSGIKPHAPLNPMQKRVRLGRSAVPQAVTRSG